MKTILVSFILSLSVISIEFKVIGPCDEAPLLHVDHVLFSDSNAGNVTINILDEFEVPYIGSEQGMNSIFNSPYGMDAMEVISDTKMRAYGWCYLVDEMEPAVYPHEVPISAEESKSITWFYAYSDYESGQWLNMCVPSWKLKSPFICK